jgi:hypothetical protein
VHTRSIAIGILALAGAVLGGIETVLACETFHLLRLRTIAPVVTPGFALCRTGCPFKFEGELDPGKGRWIFKKQDGANRIDAVWTVEKNLRTGEVFVTTTERSDRTCAPHPAVAAAFAAGAVDVNRELGCEVPDFKVKGVKPKVCPDQTLNCAEKAQKSALVLHDWDDVDDLQRGVDVRLIVPGASSNPMVFRSAKNSSPSVYFHDCCGRVEDFGAPGDPFDLRTYYAIRPATGGAASCLYETMRRNQRSDGEDLPDPQSPDEICVE